MNDILLNTSVGDNQFNGDSIGSAVVERFARTSFIMTGDTEHKAHNLPIADCL